MDVKFEKCKPIAELNVILENVKWEQALLYPMIQHYEQKETGYFKIAITITSLYLTAVAAILSQSNKVFPDVMLGSPYDIIFAAITFALCLLNVSLIKFIASNRAGCILTMRQINCLRRAIDSMNYFILYNKCPQTTDDLLKKNDENQHYWSLIGRHRKLPISNSHFRPENMSFLSKLAQSPDGFLIISIVIFSLAIFCAPVGYILLSDLVYPKGVIFGFSAIVMIFGFSVIYVIDSAKQKVDTAINHQVAPEVTLNCGDCVDCENSKG